MYVSQHNIRTIITRESSLSLDGRVSHQERSEGRTRRRVGSRNICDTQELWPEGGIAGEYISRESVLQFAFPWKRKDGRRLQKRRMTAATLPVQNPNHLRTQVRYKSTIFS